MHPSITLAVALLAFNAHGREPPSVCMVSPLANLTAGEPIMANVINPQGRPCGATLVFADANFLPITFDLEPVLCVGYQRAKILVPKEVPNGEVTVMWECAGDIGQSCSRGLIEGGTGKVEQLDRQQTGTIECLIPAATITTMLTTVQGTSTLVSLAVTTNFATNSPIMLDANTRTNEGTVTGNPGTSSGSSTTTPPAATGVTVSSETRTYSTLVMVIPQPTSGSVAATRENVARTDSSATCACTHL